MLRIFQIICIFLFWLASALAPACAQQTIIIVPSPDTLKKGQIYPRFTYRVRPFQPEPYEYVVPSVVYGLSDTQELYFSIAGMNLENNVKPTFDAAYKKVFLLTETTKYTAGLRLSTSLQSTNIPTNFLYTHFSQEIPRTKTRFTAGAYGSAVNKYYPNKPGALLGFEQYIIPDKLQFDIDWISGNETFSFLAVGFKIKPRPDIVIVPAVLLPNSSQSNGKFGFIFFIGKIF